jgi:hypothetical protein
MDEYETVGDMENQSAESPIDDEDQNTNLDGNSESLSALRENIARKGNNRFASNDVTSNLH